MGSSQEMLSTCGPRDEQWQWLDRALLMAPFPYGCLGLPQFPKYLFHGLSRNVHSPSFLDSGFLSQIYFKNKADNGIRLPAINQASALKRTTSNLPLPAHLVFHLNLCMFFQNASSSQTQFRLHLSSSTKTLRLLILPPVHSRSLPIFSLIQKLPCTCVSYLSNYLWGEEHMLERAEVLESGIYLVCLVRMRYLTFPCRE